MIKRRILLPLTLALLWSGSSLARDYTQGSIVISDPWSRATPPSAMSGAGYLTLTNKGSEPDRLIAASSPAAGRVEVHEMTMNGNVMRMRELEKGLEIPAGATVKLAPGGYHLMMTGLKGPFTKGARVPVTLTFEKAGSIDVEFGVEALGAPGPGRAH
jgi:periplasmic copper chaperone A